jgi:hypothetical protein
MGKKLESELGSVDSAPPAAVPMRFRFSLRAMLIATAILSGFCYFWIEMPRANGRRFVEAVTAENFPAADRMFWKSGDRVLTQWKEKYWGLRADAEMLPWSFCQFVSGQRDVRLHVTYFFLDEHHDLEMQIAATSLGLNSPMNSLTNSSMITDGILRTSRIIERR